MWCLRVCFAIAFAWIAVVAMVAAAVYSYFSRSLLAPVLEAVLFWWLLTVLFIVVGCGCLLYSAVCCLLFVVCCLLFDVCCLVHGAGCLALCVMLCCVFGVRCLVFSVWSLVFVFGVVVLLRSRHCC